MATIDDVYALLTDAATGLAAIKNEANAAHTEAAAAHASASYVAAFAEAWDLALSPTDPEGLRAFILGVNAWFVNLAIDYATVPDDTFEPNSWIRRVFEALYREFPTI